MCLALRMTWQTLGPVYRFRDFNALLQHTSSWPRYLTRPSNNQIIGRCGKTFIGFQPPAIFSPYHIGELVGYRAPSQWKCLGSLSVLYLCHPQIWPFSLLICTNIIIPHPPWIRMFVPLGICTGWRVSLIRQKYFFIMEILKGYGKVGARLDTRLPITVSILERMCSLSRPLSSLMRLALLPHLSSPFIN